MPIVLIVSLTIVSFRFSSFIISSPNRFLVIS
nr:MAG TPA: hypothetical protein [Caudoviricetes sp.]